MPAATVSEEEFIALWRRFRSPQELAAYLRISARAVASRRNYIEARRGIDLSSDNPRRAPRHHELDDHPAIHNMGVRDGVVLVASDCHYWNAPATTAHRGFVGFIKALAPKAVIMNGDVLDGATISRHPPIGWTDTAKPSLAQELEACAERLAEIEDAAGANCAKLWNLGNHCIRYDTKLATVAPQMSGVRGAGLKDHFPMWRMTWATMINNDVMVKHRFKGGVHAALNNTLHAGKTMVTGHTHNLSVTPFSDYNGTRFGVSTGTLADCYGPQTTDYTEVAPVNWRSGFAVLTFHNGKLLWPEVAYVESDGVIGFRGTLHHV